MTPRERIQSCQDRLIARGVTDIKFFWGNASEKPLSQVCNDVADALEAALEGRCRPVPPFGDSQRGG